MNEMRALITTEAEAVAPRADHLARGDRCCPPSCCSSSAPCSRPRTGPGPRRPALHRHLRARPWSCSRSATWASRPCRSASPRTASRASCGDCPRRPARPSGLLVAQLVINSVAAVARPGSCWSSSRTLAFGVPLPRQPARRSCRVRAGHVRACSRSGLLVAAVAPTTGVATAIVVPLFVGGDVPGRRVPAQVAPAGVPRRASATSRRPASRASRMRGWATRRSCSRWRYWPSSPSSAGAIAARVFRWE